MIRVLQRRQVNEHQWNQVVEDSLFENIYPYTWYLDVCADRWLGLVMGDYECIMPVAYRKRVGLKYAYQPFHCQQLGVFSPKPVDAEIVRMFLHKFGEVFRMGETAFNAGNVLGNERGFEDKDSTNYTLPLKDTYDRLFKNYNENCRRNVRRAHKNSLTIDVAVPLDEMLQLKQETEKVRRTQQTLDARRSVFSNLLARGSAEILGARKEGELVAAAVFAVSAQRRVFLLSASSQKGLELRGMFRVVDHYIEQHAEQQLILDFEGSNIVSIARFFRGFGAKPEIYQRVSLPNSTLKIIRKLRGV